MGSKDAAETPAPDQPRRPDPKITTPTLGPAGDRPLTVGYLVRFSLPLALTFLMMSGAAPIVSNGITWMHGEVGESIHLSAFLVTFATALLVYSPTFVARNTAIRTITDRRSLWRFAGFFLLCASMCSACLLVVSQVDVVGHFVFGRLLGTDAEIERLARRGLIAFLPVPLLVAFRGMGQGIHINNGQGWYVGYGTVLRLVTMGVFVFGFAIRHELSGPVLGGCTYLFGISAETLFVLVLLRGKPQWTTAGDGPTLTLRQFGAYTLPLMAASTCQQLVTPILIYLINHGRQPLENGATFNLMRDTGWILFSTLHSIQPAVVTHATSRQRLRALLRFAFCLWAGITGLVMLVALTPVKTAVFVTWLQVDNRVIVELTFLTLLWMIPLPLINLFVLFVSALHTRSSRTPWVTAGNMIALGMLWCGATMLDLSAYSGVVLAIIGSGLFHLAAAVIQAVGLLNGGLTAALSPATLAEHLNHPEETLPDGLETPEPVPERVRR